MALPLDEQARNQQKREWARDNGWPELAERGRLPAAVDAAFEAWEAASSGRDDGADFAAAAAAMGLSPLDDDSQLDADGGGTAPPPDMPGGPEGARDAGQSPAGQQAPDGLPPVRSLDEARQRVAAGKAQPAWARPPAAGKGGSGRQGAAGGAAPRRGRKAQQPQQPAGAEPIEVDQKVLDDMAGKLAMLVAVPGKWWQRVDPTCGGAFAQQSPDILEALVPVMARSQAVVRMFMIDALFFQLFALVTAAWPVAEAIYSHHYSEEAQQRKQGERRAAAEQQTRDDDLAMYPSSPVVTVAGHTPQYRPPQARM